MGTHRDAAKLARDLRAGDRFYYDDASWEVEMIHVDLSYGAERRSTVVATSGGRRSAFCFPPTFELPCGSLVERTG